MPSPKKTPHKTHILCVDDDLMVTELFQEVLEDSGYQVTAKTSSTEALKVFQDRPHQIDLVITDMSMPKITGVELALELIDLRPEIPIILCTGYHNEVLAKNHDGLFQERLLKPISQKVLLGTIRRLLNQKNK
jgi:two-component system, cell cycle sensor histidine kinase and response regulator CckA